MKKTEVFCDICKVQCKDTISIYISNEESYKLRGEKLERIDMGKEEHFCPECTTKIKEFINNLIKNVQS